MGQSKTLEEKVDILGEKVDTLQKSNDRMDRDLGTDREEIGGLRNDIQQVRSDLANLQTQFEEIIKLIKRTDTRIQDKMADVVQPMIDEAQDLKDVIEQKKVIAIEDKKLKKKAFWQFWKRR